MRNSRFNHDPARSGFKQSATRNTSDKLRETLTELINENHEPKCNELLRKVTIDIIPLLQKINPKFYYDPRNNPMRCLTQPSEGVFNNGYDNNLNEYILYVRDSIKSPEHEEYIILELLGKGTFGQVVKCIKAGTNQYFAIKVIKNKAAYTNQAMLEIKIFKKLEEENPVNHDHIVRMVDYFVFRNHICLVFELLHVSLYDLLRLSNFSGFSLKFIQRLTEQIVDGLCCLERNKIIHCDLKPENILFADDRSDVIKVIDLGSSCFIYQTLYVYIQSRFYRAPEVIMGMKYTNKIDSWSLGCIVAEFYLGLPLFPGNSEYDQMRRIIELLGMPENEVIESGRFKNKFFRKEEDEYFFKTLEEYEQEQGVKLQPHKKYFVLKRLEDLENYYNKSKQREKNQQDRQRFDVFLHFLKGLLNLNPVARWSAAQARSHPFLTNEPFDPDWQPPTPQQAIENLNANLHQSEEHKSDTQTPRLPVDPSQNPESHRPPIPVDRRDDNYSSQSQTVNLINAQTETGKNKKKLNLNAGSFFALNPQLAINTNMAKEEHKKGSYSEPNSGRSHYYGKQNKYKKEELSEDQQHFGTKNQGQTIEENVLNIPENLPNVDKGFKKSPAKVNSGNSQNQGNQAQNQGQVQGFNFNPNMAMGVMQNNGIYMYNPNQMNQNMNFIPNQGNINNNYNPNMGGYNDFNNYNPNFNTFNNFNQFYGNQQQNYQQAYNQNFQQNYQQNYQNFPQQNYQQNYNQNNAQRQRSNSDHTADSNINFHHNRKGYHKKGRDSAETTPKGHNKYGGYKKGGGGGGFPQTQEESKDEDN